MDAGSTNIRRGIDFANRVWSGGLASNIQKKFSWWKGGKFNRLTFIFLSFIFLLNLILVFPLFTRDVTASFQSAFFLLIGNFFEYFGIPKHFFFSAITIISLLIAPISIYLFARKIALRHELIAFLSALFFILPTPISGGKLSLATSILAGDGAHAVAFAFIPLFLLYILAFISTGESIWGVMSAIAMAVVAIISPFAFFNLVILITLVTISDGFMGNLRIKLLRSVFLILATIGLTLFWYVPSVLRQITVISHVRFALNQFLSVSPLLIPIIPVVGSLAFLIFDRREKLRPIFVGISFFLVYLALYMTSQSLQSTGIFTPQRYTPELAFSGAFLFSIVFVSSAEVFIRSVLVKLYKTAHHFLFIIVVSAVVSFLGFLTITQIQEAHSTIATQVINDQYALGIGNMRRSVNYFDVTTIFASIVSLGTLWFLIHTLKNFPARILRKKTVE